MSNPLITTTIDPKEVRAKHSRILCQDGEFPVTADAEIINEDYDPATKTYTLQIGLHYPHRSTRPTISLAIPARKDGKMVAVKPPEHWMTQEDFDAHLRGEPVKVPTHY
jgi:hypothetical protein